MKNLILALALIAISPMTVAYDNPAQVQLDQATSTRDPAHLMSVIARCAGFYLATGTILENSDAEMGRNFTLVAANLYVKVKDMMQDDTIAQASVAAHYDAYLARMNTNWVQSGTHLTGDTIIEADMDTCNLIRLASA